MSERDPAQEDKHQRAAERIIEHMWKIEENPEAWKPQDDETTRPSPFKAILERMKSEGSDIDS